MLYINLTTHANAITYSHTQGWHWATAKQAYARGCILAISFSQNSTNCISFHCWQIFWVYFFSKFSAVKKNWCKVQTRVGKTRDRQWDWPNMSGAAEIEPVLFVTEMTESDVSLPSMKCKCYVHQ